MNNRKSSKKRLAGLKAEHWKLDRLVLHLTAQATENSRKSNQSDQNKLKEFKKRKLALRDEIARIESEIHSSYELKKT